MPNIFALSPGDPVSQMALKGLRANAPILDDLMLVAKPGSAVRVKTQRSATTKTLITRTLNSDNTPTAPTPTYDTPAKSIVSFDAKVDVIIEDRNEDPEAELAQQTYLEAFEAGWEFQDLIFHGDQGNVATDFDGFDNLVDSGWIFTDGLAVPVGGDAVIEAQQLAVEKLLNHAARVRGGAQVVYMPEVFKVRWLNAAKHIGYYRMGKDALGNEVDMIGNIMVKGAGLTKTGGEILTTETLNGDANTYSFWFARWGEGVDLFGITSVGLKGRYAGQIGNHIINNVNMDMVLELQNVTSLVRSRGWKLASE